MKLIAKGCQKDESRLEQWIALTSTSPAGTEPLMPHIRRWKSSANFSNSARVYVLHITRDDLYPATAFARDSNVCMYNDHA